MVQCKFTSKADKHLKLADLKDELAKAERLATRGLSDCYFLFSNARLTGESEAKIREAFEAIPGIKRFSAFGCERISRIIRESARLRMLVPRIYGLGDLSQIFDERAYDQALEILSALGDDLAKFVITEAYERSAKALVEHGFVMLLGEPACGKSTIAAALAVGALDEWGCSTLKIRNADDFVAHSNPHEQKQFFWVDDAFGATQFDWSSGAGWNRVFPHIHAAIRRGAKVLFTSRDYVYRSARQILKESAFPLLRESQVVIQVERLSKGEREQILYNHIRLGRQSKEYKSRIKPYLPGVAAHHRFSPEIARRLGDPLFTRNLAIWKEALDEFVEEPLEFLCEIIRTLDAGSRSALASIFMRGGVLPSPVTMSADEERAVALFGGSIADVKNALNALNESLVIQSLQAGNYVWKFKHPTIRDAFAALVAEDRELMDIYLTGTPVEKLFGEVSCGDVGLQGVKVIVPADRFQMLMTRLESFDTKKLENEWELHRFLAYRCSLEFLTAYIARYPQFIPRLSVGSYLTAVSDVDVVVRLHSFGLLPEEKRLRVVEIIRGLAVETPDSGFLRPRIRELLTASEVNDILEDVRKKLLPNLENEISNFQWNFKSEDDPESHFEELRSAFKDYRNEFISDPSAVARLDVGLARIDEVVEELRLEQPQEEDGGEFRGLTSHEHGEDDRSIFEDVDH